MFYVGLKFPHRAMVLHVLERCCKYQFKWPLCKKKSAVLVVVWCYKARGDREQDLWKYWLPEGWFISGMTSLWVAVASITSVVWGRNETLTLLYLVPWPRALICSM